MAINISRLRKAFYKLRQVGKKINPSRKRGLKIAKEQRKFRQTEAARKRIKKHMTKNWKHYLPFRLFK